MLANRFISYGFFVEFYLDNQWIAAAGFTLSNVLGYGQFVGQTLISVNRFTVFWIPAKHKEIWQRKWYLIILIGLPLLVIPTRLPNVGKIVFSKSGAAATYADENMEKRNLYMTSAVYFVNGTITAVLSVFTVFKYWRLRVGNVIPIPQIESLFGNRFISYGFFTEFYLDNQWLAAARFTLSNVFGYGQFVGQTLISINRFTVFWFPAKHKRIWTRKWYLIVLIGLPLLVIPTRLPNVGKIVFSKSGAAATYADEVMETRALYMTSTVYFVNGTITAILSVLTIFKYWRLRVGNVMPIPQIQARMLAFSIVIYSIQMLRVVYVVIRNIFLPYPSINAFLMYLLPFISDLHAWVCSISLVCMSQASRKAYIDFYFGNVSLRAPKILFLSSLTPPAPHVS
uniref:Serpentine receptor class gamma n=1 Tax=Panagrellus redivivus TaxID=6233 RepID=A0A7E4WAG0_PANRE